MSAAHHIVSFSGAAAARPRESQMTISRFISGYSAVYNPLTVEHLDGMAEPPAARRERRFVLDGVAWTVHEARIAYLGDVYSLVFESPKIVRRTRNYPADWFDLGPADLAALARSR
jgi:hypothetical protein